MTAPEAEMAEYNHTNRDADETSSTVRSSVIEGEQAVAADPEVIPGSQPTMIPPNNIVRVSLTEIPRARLSPHGSAMPDSLREPMLSSKLGTPKKPANIGRSRDDFGTKSCCIHGKSGIGAA